MEVIQLTHEQFHQLTVWCFAGFMGYLTTILGFVWAIIRNELERRADRKARSENVSG